MEEYVINCCAGLIEENLCVVSKQRSLYPNERHILVGKMKSATTNGDCVALNDLYTSLNAFCTFDGAHGRPFTKKNCLSVPFLPHPTANLEMRPFTCTSFALLSRLEHLCRSLRARILTPRPVPAPAAVG